ncbi:TetR/AcrR family transcriptional regulator [Demequina gelatinilytica]|uniref:TetR/AcrR family transcriptional regulator n=1 Tax=Demequina gelatinilytica TaxID=1638980 RepID=UPI000780F648|nr:TetR/AcrR family transcriptional regulator [Demequina gelatinilytica]
MPRAHLTAAAVIHEAMLLADRESYDAVTVSAVARSLGVRPASLYAHVRDRDALLAGVHQSALGELGSRLATELAGRSGRDALAALADTHRRFATEHPGAWTALQRPSSEATARSSEAALVAALISGVVRGYPLPASAVVDAVRLVSATITGFVALTDAKAFAHRPQDVGSSWAAAIDALDRALSTWPQEGPSA